MPGVKLSHRTQLFLTDEQYRWLKVRAGSVGRVAQVGRDWIDSELEPGADLSEDTFIRFLLDDPGFSTGSPVSVETLDQELYGSNPGDPDTA